MPDAWAKEDRARSRLCAKDVMACVSGTGAGAAVQEDWEVFRGVGGVKMRSMRGRNLGGEETGGERRSARGMELVPLAGALMRSARAGRAELGAEGRGGEMRCAREAPCSEGAG